MQGPQPGSQLDLGWARKGWGAEELALYPAQPWVPGQGEWAGLRLTQAKAELVGCEEAGVGLVQALKYGLQLLWGQGQVALQALQVMPGDETLGLLVTEQEELLSLLEHGGCPLLLTLLLGLFRAGHGG